jgi:hypothetical protein
VDDPLGAIVAAYQQQHGWQEEHTDEWFNCPTEEEIREDSDFGEDEFEVGFLGGSSGGNEYNIRVWKVEDDAVVGMKAEEPDDKPLDHPSNEDALDTIDALVFSGSPADHELDRIEHFCQRWLRGIKEHRDTNADVKAEENGPGTTGTGG